MCSIFQIKIIWEVIQLLNDERGNKEEKKNAECCELSEICLKSGIWFGSLVYMVVISSPYDQMVKS